MVAELINSRGRILSGASRKVVRPSVLHSHHHQNHRVIADKGLVQLSTELRHTHGLRGQLRPRRSTWSLVVIPSTDFNTDSCCRRTMDPDTVLRGSTSPDITTASGVNTGLSHQAVPPLLKTVLSTKYFL